MYCKDCKFSRDDKDSNGLLECINAIDYNEVRTNDDVDVSDQRRAYPYDYEECNSGLLVGRLFGCINFQQKGDKDV